MLAMMISLGRQLILSLLYFQVITASFVYSEVYQLCRSCQFISLSLELLVHLFLSEDYLLLRLVLVDCRSSLYLAIKLQGIQKVMRFISVISTARVLFCVCVL